MSRTLLDDVADEARGDWLDFRTDFDWEDIQPSREDAERDRREIR